MESLVAYFDPLFDSVEGNRAEGGDRTVKDKPKFDEMFGVIFGDGMQNSDEG